MEIETPKASVPVMENGNSHEHPKKVLIVEGHPKYFVSHRLPWARAASEAGYEVHVTALKNGNGDLIRNEGFPYHDIAERDRGGNPLSELGFLLKLYRLLRALEPDLVHFITLRSVLYGIVPAHFAGERPVLNSITGLGFLFTDDAWSVRLLRQGVLGILSYALGRPNQLTTFQNPDDAEVFISQGVVAEERVTVTPGSGVDPKRFPYAEETSGDGGQNQIVMLPTRLLWEKGVEEFVGAAQRLCDCAVDAQFVIVGETDPENPGAVPRVQLEAWNQNGPIEWWGYQDADEMPHVLRKASIVCLPSYREGVPKVLIEAASCGRPIVTTDVPGCREIVNDGENGFLVPARDAEALADRIATLIADPSLRATMGQRGRDRVEAHFTADQVARTIVNAYDRLLRQAGT